MLLFHLSFLPLSSGKFSDIYFNYFYQSIPSLILVVSPEFDLPVDNLRVVKWKGSVLRCEATFQFISL